MPAPTIPVELTAEVKSLQANVSSCLDELTNKMQDIEEKVQATQRNME